MGAEIAHTSDSCARGLSWGAQSLGGREPQSQLSEAQQSLDSSCFSFPRRERLLN